MPDPSRRNDKRALLSPCRNACLHILHGYIWTSKAPKPIGPYTLRFGIRDHYFGYFEGRGEPRPRSKLPALLIKILYPLAQVDSGSRCELPATPLCGPRLRQAEANCHLHGVHGFGRQGTHHLRQDVVGVGQARAEQELACITEATS